MNKIKKITIFLIITVSVLLITNAVVLKVTNKNILETTGKLFRTVLGFSNENKTVEFESDNYDEPGSWKITENVKWNDSNKLEITYNLTSIIETYNKNKDVILMIDTSGSMFGDKLQTLKDNSIELLDTLLEVETNKIALIEFNTTSNIIQEFTNDKETLINKINSMNANGGTNYNQALQNLDTILDSYNKESSRDLVVMFLTDGYPVEENPSQKATYQILKSKYDYLEINGIQYEMGETLKQEVKDITDRQYTANTNNLSNVLLKVLVSPKKYDEFKIEKQISDYFEIIDASTTNGNITIDSSKTKIACNMNKSYLTGSKETITVIAKLKEPYQTQIKEYEVNANFKVNYKISDEQEEYQSSKTPVIANAYDVKYELNKPSGCNLESIDTTKHLVYSNVEISQNKLKCEGYLFKGFKILNNNVTKMNDDTFIMPGEDVTISAEWTKLSLSKTMDGTIKEKTTLYQAIADQENILTKKYAGEHKDSFTQAATHDIYYFYANDTSTANSVLNNNNVIFANQCWQILRTTDTGGVKLIYDGEPDSEGKCGTNRGTHVGYASRTNQALNSNYYYGTSYNFDASTKTFILSGEIEQKTWNDSTASSLIGKYTCKSATEDGTCSTLYLIESYNSSTKANVIPLNSNSNYSQFGTLQFNASYNSPAFVGYMYGTPYTYSQTDGTKTETFTKTETLLSSSSLNTTYYYSDTIDYGTQNSSKYTLINPYLVSSTDDYPNLIGKYTFRNTSSSYTNSSVYYIAYINGSTMYYKQLSNSQTLDEISPISFGESITDNGDGTYTLESINTIEYKDWYTNYSTYKGKYTCNNNSITCTNPRYVTATTKTNYTYVDASEKILIAKTRNGINLANTLLISKDELLKNYTNYNEYKYTCNSSLETCTEDTLRMITALSATGYTYAVNHYFGTSVTYENGKYNLVNPLEIESATNLNDISTHHYICVSPGQKECSTVAYVYYYTGSGTMYYITLKDGETSVNTALDKMLNQNTTSSTMKVGLEAWYERNLLNYSSYIEDTIYCNDRSYKNFESSGWNENGGKTDTYLQFKEYSVTSDLSCTKQTDQFSTSNESAKLKYPIGLATSPEMNILNNATVRKTGQYYWLASPDYFNFSNAYERYVYSIGSIYYDFVNYSSGVRPAVSLISGTEYVSGDGSTDNPYIVE